MDSLRKELRATQLVVETLRKTLRGRTHANAILRDELTAERDRFHKKHLDIMNDVAERTAERDAAYERIAELEGALRHAHADHATDAYADAHARAMSGGGAAAADNHCPVCTFVNTRDASTCTMCDSKLH